MSRSWPELLATGFTGGADVSIGVFALLLVLDWSDSHLLASLAFSIGFLIILLAKSELFTENFLVPLLALVATPDPVRALVRLWTGTAVFNLLGGWFGAWVIINAFPQFHEEAVRRGGHFVELGIGPRSLAVAFLAGAIITLMTWMIEGAASAGPRMVASVAAAFLLAAGEMNHCIVASVDMFTALVAGAPFGYLDWAVVFLWAALGNMLGGGTVTFLRFLQAGRGRIREQGRRVSGS